MARPAVDPRSIITPDSFGVAQELLGLPLASPSRRAAAMAIDLLAVALLTQAGGVFFGILAAAALWRASAASTTKTGYVRTGVRGLLRGAAALVVFVVVLNGVDAIGNRMTDDDQDGGTISLCGSQDITLALSDLGNIPMFIALEEADDPAMAEEAAARVTAWLREKRLNDDELRTTLDCLRNDTESEYGRTALGAQIALLGVDDSVRTAALGTATSPDSALLAYASARVRGDTTLVHALDSLALATVAGERVTDLEEDYDELRAENAELRMRIERFGWTDRVRSIVTEDLGLGFGWMALYFTALLALFRGQTLGKRLLGVRVIRLDARPLSWWISFERFGGYAASLSTGLLGFVQILWDRNRQGLHDKAVETVVIRIQPGIDYIAGARTASGARVGSVRGGAASTSA